MEDTAHKAIAVVGVGAVLPDAPDAQRFWANLTEGRYSISEVQADRWDPALYFDPDPKARDKSYTKIGGWCRDWAWEPLKWKLPVPPRVGASMDRGQKWAVIATREALGDYGYPGRPLDPDRTAVIMGTAMGGDMQLLTAARIFFPEYSDELNKAPSFSSLPQATRDAVVEELFEAMGRRLPPISEDTMPGELANIVAGRIAALFDLHGPNYICDAACASAMAAITAAAEGLIDHDYDAVVTGGIDANMSASTFTKFCKIGALSATGTRPYDEGADGFVMGEGAGAFLLKRLADAERDGDRVYAVLRGVGGASDGKGKGITAPNPVGQKLAVERAWQNAGLSPATVTMIEGHGTSTRVGDKVEAQVLEEVFRSLDLPRGRIALGSVKSNIGHLKGGAGAAGLLKATLALHHKTLPPSLNFERPNAAIDFDTSPFRVNTELRPWDETRDGVRRAGVSAFGFGGTNFHAVLEEYIPGRIPANGRRSVAVPAGSPGGGGGAQAQAKAPLRGALLIGGDSEQAVAARLKEMLRDGEAGKLPPPCPPRESDLRARVRLAIDYGDVAELEKKGGRALKALEGDNQAAWKALRAQGVFLGRGPAAKVAFLYTGQGSQYVNMLQQLRDEEPLVASIFRKADAVMTPLLDGRPLSDYIFVDGEDPDKVRQAERDLRQTAITQPAVLATDASMTALLEAYGITPDMVMGHSLGEYGALVASGALPFEDALEAVSARGREMTKVSVEDNGAMAAVFGPIDEIQRTLDDIDGYVVVANINSNGQAVIGGATEAVKQAAQAFEKRGFQAIPLPVSHAFHTRIVAPASGPLRQTLERLRLKSPELPLVANTTGTFYPMGPDVKEQMLDILAEQIASPVQFVKGLETLYQAGARIFVEVGPKKALHGFVEDVLGDRGDVTAIFTNHPKLGDVTSFNQALCGLYAAGLGVGRAEHQPEAVSARSELRASASSPSVAPLQVQAAPAPLPPLPAQSTSVAPAAGPSLDSSGYVELGKLFADFIQRGLEVYSGQPAQGQSQAYGGSVTITGAGIGLPGTERVFSDDNVARMLRGEQFIDAIPMRHRKEMLDKNIVRLLKTDGGASFERIEQASEVIKLAGRAGALDLVEEFGFPQDRLPALDQVTKLAIGAGLDALRDAGIPLVLRYKTTTRGTKLPDRWMLPEQMRDDTGVVFASAFPGYGALIDDVEHYHRDRARRERLSDLEAVRTRLQAASVEPSLLTDVEHRIAQLENELEQDKYAFDRRFIFKVLAMGHSQFAEYIGARGPNTHVNAACASTTHAVSIAEDWIRAGRCRRVIVLSADDVTSDTMLEWFGPGFLITGAAATDELVEDAAVPFDKRRHGMLLGMGAAAIVVEGADSASERGIRPICEVLSTVTSNSAFHGTRLDITHISALMEELVTKAEKRYGIDRRAIASQTLFVSHETYTPARGGSAQAEVQALRDTFAASADQIVIANTKGMTGHAMGAGMEDVVAIKALETGQVPPVANYKVPDPELGTLNLSRGGAYPLQYAMRLGAGFGSQIALSLVRWVPTPDGRRPAPQQIGYESRLVDRARYEQWAATVSGYQRAEVEVAKRTLRVKDQGPPQLQPAAAPVRPDVAHAVAQTAGAPATVRAPGASLSVAAPDAASVVPAPARVAPAAAAVAANLLAVLAPAVPSLPKADPVAESVLADRGGADRLSDQDMLDVELDLEADLGIDTVKQAETFAAIRDAVWDQA
jgi:acyl transferase domain-containing protein